MSNFKLSAGASRKNSVTFFLKKIDNGVEAIRQEDGTIITKKVSSLEHMKINMIFIKIIFVCGLFREFCFLLNLQEWLYHVPTVIFVFLYVIAVITVLKNHEMRMYHGAEHKVANWYSKKNKKYDIENIEKCSQIHRLCGTNFLATIVTFQLASSICMSYFNFHILEIITTTLPFFVYNIIPFNLLGMLTQIITTATPKREHISVAMQALATLIKDN